MVEQILYLLDERRMTMKKIIFLMPAVAHKPTEGFKVIYEYANRLSRAGYDVTCCYSVTPPKPYVNNAGIFTVLAKHIAKLLLNYYTCRCWFALDKSVHELHVWNLEQKNVPYADIYIATAVRTSYFLDRYKIDEKIQKKLYLIQGYENWDCPDEFVDLSYKLDLKKIVISDWLLEKVREQGENAILCYNGFDFNYFKMTNPIENRSSYIIAMLYHENEYKRCCDAFAALEIVKKKIPQIRVNIFGQYKKPNLPDWFTYYQRPNREIHNALLNETAIFIYASRTEGFCLPPAESMICGCAVYGTDIPGIPYIKNGVTMLVSPPENPEALAQNIIHLIEDNELRLRIAKNGHNFIFQHYKWEDSLEKIIEEIER